MKKSKAFGVLALVCGVAVGIHAQRESDVSKPEVPLMTVVGCASRAPDGTWMLINATAGTEARQLFTSTKEIDEAKKQKLGSNRYRLIGTTDFLTKEELLANEVRRQFTRPEVANATGQLQHGKKLVVKGLLITAPKEKRLNLVSVQQLSDTCK